MENKLQAIITRIEQSKLSEEEKTQLFTIMAEGLHLHVLPILLEHIPQDQLNELSADMKVRVTVDTYAKLISDVLTDTQVQKEIEDSVNPILVQVEKILSEENIV